MAMCAELAELAMQLARAAAARSLAEWAEPAQPIAAPPPEQTPPADREAPAATPAPRRAAAALAPKPSDPAVLFTRLAATVRDCIALEHRLAAAADAPNARARRTDPRRTLMREALSLVTENHPDRAALMREATALLDEQQDAGQDPANNLGALPLDICEELGIECDLAKIPDKYLFPPAGPASRDDETPDPRSTYPP